MREIFRKARSASPSIIFFVRFSRFALLRIQISAQDEIDALASSRSPAAVDGGTHEGVLLSLLNEMDGVEELIGVTVIGATNRPEALVSCPFPCCTASSPSHFEMLVPGSGSDTPRKARSYFIRGTTEFHWSRRYFPYPHTQHGRRPCARSRCACYPRAST